jgi:DNA-binding response OmpR family regulator
LENEGHDVYRAFSIEEAFQKLTPDYDLIMVDIFSKDKCEFDLIEKYHKESGIPIIFLAELKPFIFKNLIDHVNKTLKIAKYDKFSDESLKIGKLCIDPLSKMVKIGDSIIPLTKMEYEILYIFVSNPFKPYSCKQILDIVWKDSKESVTIHAADTHIARIRKKLGIESRCILNRPGFGYVFDPCVLLSDKSEE